MTKINHFIVVGDKLNNYKILMVGPFPIESGFNNVNFYSSLLHLYLMWWWGVVVGGL